MSKFSAIMTRTN